MLDKARNPNTRKNSHTHTQRPSQIHKYRKPHTNKLFKPTNMLDFSAGWGDRLIGAIAYGTKYTGVDPSNCLKKKYLKIINTLADNTKNYRIINQPFEETDLEDNIYDFIFTSPPFFTYEVYETDNQKQSIKNW